MRDVQEQLPGRKRVLEARETWVGAARPKHVARAERNSRLVPGDEVKLARRNRSLEEAIHGQGELRAGLDDARFGGAAGTDEQALRRQGQRDAARRRDGDADAGAHDPWRIDDVLRS